VRWTEEYQERIEKSKVQLQKDHGIDECWSSKEMTKAFKIEYFSAPYCIGTRKADGVRIRLQFGNFPARLYFDMVEVGND